jgi:hypothetical protein
MKCFIFLMAFTLFQEVPFKPNEEFEIKVDYQFKQRPAPDVNTVHIGSVGQLQRSNLGVLPYLVLHIKVLALPHEKTRMAIITNLEGRPVHKKISVNSVYELDMGFTVDMIDRITAHEYTLTFLDENKNALNRIHISVGEDGSFMVNGEKRGQI